MNKWLVICFRIYFINVCAYASFVLQVVIIQKYYRRWLAKKYVEQVRVDKAKRMEWERGEEIRKKQEKENRIQREFQRRMNPKSKEDFDLLYHALESKYSSIMSIDHVNFGLGFRPCLMLDV